MSEAGTDSPGISDGTPGTEEERETEGEKVSCASLLPFLPSFLYMCV